MDENKSTVFKFIELMLYWEGQVNTVSLQRQFGKSRQQNSSYLNEYLDKNKNNNGLTYSHSSKAYIASSDYTPIFIEDSVDLYFNWLKTGIVFSKKTSNFIDSLTLPQRKISNIFVRSLVKAMRENRRIEVDYVSLNNPSSEGRIIVPHHIVIAGTRSHVRAWCEKSKSFRDFVLGRFKNATDVLDKSTVCVADDIGWNTPVDIILKPDPRLSLAKQKVIENDYQMTDGSLYISTRGCLVQYLLREMQVSIKVLDGTPEAQQLICVNLPDIRQWLFE